MTELNLTSEQKEEIRQRILDFDDWKWCECSECRYSALSHAIETEASLLKLIESVLSEN